MPFFGKTLNFARPGGKLKTFVAVRFEEGSDPEYHMFATADQDWVVIKSSESGGTLLYAAGQGNIVSNWADRAGLSYQEYWALAAV